MHVDEALRSYDETFCKLRESSTLPWEQPVNELRLKIAAMGSKVQYKQYTQLNGKKNRFVPSEYASFTTEESNVMHFPVNMPIFVKNVTTDIHYQNARPPLVHSPKIINLHKIILRSLRNTLGRVYNLKE